MLEKENTTQTCRRKTIYEKLIKMHCLMTFITKVKKYYEQYEKL